MSLFESASLVVTPNGTKASKLYAIKPTSGAGDLSVTRATTATRVNSAGLIESVASNVPRLDYTNSTCPSVLVEPQRTNLVLYSEQFDNAYWTKQSTTVTANNTTSPDGNVTADKIVSNAVNDEHLVYYFEPTILNQVLTISVFVKKLNYRYAILRSFTTGAYRTSVFDLDNGTITSQDLGASTIKSFGNGWYRISATFTSPLGVFGIQYGFSASTGITYNGDGTSGNYAWGFQTEAGSYATSYIPTTSASVTRNADVISKTGISSLIGQTEGTVFVDIDINSSYAQDDMRFISVSDGTSANWYFIGTNNANEFRFYFRASNTIYVTNSSSFTSGRHKLAFAYKNNDYVAYVDGVQVNNTTTLAVGSTSQIELGNSFSGNLFKQFNNLTALWKTRLTNAELAELTTL
jgi:hypothetical protein